MTSYFRDDVLPKLPYIRLEWCLAAIEKPVSREIQPDGRIRYWWYVEDFGKYLRVVHYLTRSLCHWLGVISAFQERIADFLMPVPLLLRSMPRHFSCLNDSQGIGLKDEFEEAHYIMLMVAINQFLIRR